MTTGKKITLFVLLILIADQILKVWIKTSMTYGQDIKILGNRAYIYFIENNGMAFGMEFGGEAGKIFLTLFRIAAAIAIGWYLSTLIKKRAHTGLIFTIGAILAGAIGNIIDSTFYGLIFSESLHYEKATLFPADGGYAGLFRGKVVDMFYFPVINTTWPEWFPYRPGQQLIFFRPVFNIADASITTGVISLIVFQKRFFEEGPVMKPEEEPTV